ncbi:MAG: hypothetical protein EPO09_21775 [Aquabacterium sp.]|uniref:hypothetical protein n=1 Tax=Aquabacterium sp. TaxID=1872578 RepID=UPI001204EC51|nr:hypothetical protein [Aquabacterium sp.]TAK81883.1 MAG: hypothetical protein EPO09_21775 [Aquabacterium sp.]
MPADALTPSPIQRFVDNNGNALVGGLLFTYAAGTTTKLATYTDSTGNTQQTNPIVLNSRGEPENNLGTSVGIWLTSASYKFVLAPAGDTDPPTNPIWTLDGITVGAGSFPIPNDTVLGNVSGAPAIAYALTQAQFTAIINPFTSTLAGDVPASGGGTANFLRADATWGVPPGTATAYTASGGITLSGVNFTLSTIANQTVLGNVSGGVAGPIALSQAQLTTLINAFTSGLSGAAPASGGGTINFLRADGTWAVPAQAAGISASTFSNPGVFAITIPTVAMKFTLVGGGGGSDGTFDGGLGAMAIRWLSGLTIGNTLTVTVGNGGNSGAPGLNGGDSLLTSGSQVIATVTAGGGKGANGSAGAAGTATGGTLNVQPGPIWSPNGVGAHIVGFGGGGLVIAEW